MDLIEFQTNTGSHCAINPAQITHVEPYAHNLTLIGLTTGKNIAVEGSYQEVGKKLKEA